MRINTLSRTSTTVTVSQGGGARAAIGDTMMLRGRPPTVRRAKRPIPRVPSRCRRHRPWLLGAPGVGARRPNAPKQRP